MRAICNIGDLTQKWVFGRAKQGLRKDGILNTKFGLKFGETVEKEKRKGRGRRGRGRRGVKIKPTRYGTLDFVWKLPLVMDYMRLCMNFHAWLVISLSPNLGFC